LTEKVKRTKTKTPNIYFNENTKKYDVKYNFKIYDPYTQKNKYKSQWAYNLNTIAEAKTELAKLQAGQTQSENKEITIEGAYQLWEKKAKANNFSPVTIKNTKEHMRMIYQYLPKNTKIKNITEETYQELATKCRDHGYAEETLHSINSTFRKLINLTHKRKLISENILHTVDNVRTGRKKPETYRLISLEDFNKLDEYFKTNEFIRLGKDIYFKYWLLINLLYYTGMRIGEVLALKYNDFVTINGAEDSLHTMRVKVTKSYNTDFKIEKETKNYKNRTIPITKKVEKIYLDHVFTNYGIDYGEMEDKIFDMSHGAVNTTIGTACKKLGLKHEYNCHEFRHTFISNLIRNNVPMPVIERVSGDTAATILERYSHMFPEDENMVILALENLGKNVSVTETVLSFD